MQPSQKAKSKEWRLCLCVAVDIHGWGQVIFPRICWKCPNWLIVWVLMFWNCWTKCFPFYQLHWQLSWELAFLNTTETCYNSSVRFWWTKSRFTKVYLLPSKVIVVIRILIARFWLYNSEIPTFFIAIFVF